MKYICPLLTVSDMNRSRQFYETLLQQKVKYDFGENITFHGDFAIHLRSHFSQLIDGKEIRTGGNNFELYFEEDDVEGIVAQLKKHDVRFVHDIREQPWRQKVVRFYDWDENIIEIGESMEHLVARLWAEGMLVDEIARITNMGDVFVNSIIQANLI